ncbi:MAG: tRNA uridine-5-carboxymethylaminomethyl(34) synthesis GTPase MnmE [Candidatus Caldatribacteriota bacterium]
MRLLEKDTIVAISTPPGESGIGIIRMSGNKAMEIAQKVFRDKNLKGKKIVDYNTHTAHYGFIVDPENKKIIDEIVFILMKKPYSYTREDMIEFNCHGGILILKKVIELLLKCGARLANPGEFTKRAFLNGRIDLSQAEAVIDLIQAKTERSLQSSLAQLEGRLKEKITKLREALIEILAEIEANLDFPDQDIRELNVDKLSRRIKNILEEVNNLLKTFTYGKIIREGINVVIIGKTNVGKSSLFNTLLKENRAIVTPLPGTTRDALEELINLQGIAFRIIDTAGIKNPENQIEEISLSKMKSLLERADLILAMFDISAQFSQEDEEIIQEVNKAIEKNKKVLIIENKIDLERKMEKERLFSGLKIKESIRTSMKEGLGIDKLEKEMVKTIFQGIITPPNGLTINNIRQREALQKAKKALKFSLRGIRKNIPYDLLYIDLREALDFLGEITGEQINEEIIENIFSRFCIGK